MRNKFTELIQQGVAKFEYTPIAQETPEYDPICREYNNLFGLVNDTHMSCTQDGHRIITGHIINTPKWDEFVTAHIWGTFEFKQYWSLSDWAFKYNFELTKGLFNGDKVIYVHDTPQVNIPVPVAKHTYTTTESNIPQLVSTLTTNGDINKFMECFGGNIDEVVKNLNESLYIKGNNWIHDGSRIMGFVGNKVCIL